MVAVAGQLAVASVRWQWPDGGSGRLVVVWSIERWPGGTAWLQGSRGGQTMYCTQQSTLSIEYNVHSTVYTLYRV